MRTGILFEVSPADRLRVARDRNAPQKHVWRASIILLSADRGGTAAIMRRTGTSKTCVWRWQERFMVEGVDGLLRDKTRPSRIDRLAPEVADRVVTLTLTDAPGETTHWTADIMASASGISASAVQASLRSLHRFDCAASGKHTACNRIASGSSSCRMTPSLPRSFTMWSGFTSRRQPTPSCCRSMRRARYRRSTGPSRG